MVEFRCIDTEASFAPDYATARARFRAAVAAAGGAPAAIAHPLAGPAGEALAIDLAWFGPRDAARVLVLVCATHGVEGFCGAGAQADWIASGGPAALPPGTAALLVHALNPHGFAWLRRVTEEGIDLNRNGVDFAGSIPANAAYATLAGAFVPADLDPRTLAEADALIERFRETHGTRALDHARSAGQYTHVDGIFYGGTEPAWSMRQLAAICREFRLAEREGVAIIDYHTGLGPHGHGEPIVGHRPGTPGQERCRAWYGDSLGEPLLGSSFSIPIAGLSQYAWARAIGDDVLTFIALEFGTYASERGHTALRADHVVHRAGLAWDDPATVCVKAELRKFYHPDTRPWKELVLLRSRQVIAQALAGLSGAPIGDRSI